MIKQNLKIAVFVAVVVTFTMSFTATSSAQSRQYEQEANAIVNLIGTIAQASAKSNAKKKWAQVSPDIHQCVNTVFSSKNINVDQIIAAGIAPNNEQIAPVITSCQTIMTTQLKADFPCTVTNAKGQQVPSTCSQSYAKAVNGSWTPISRDDFLRAAANNETVNVGNFETIAGQNARLNEENRLAQQAAAKEEEARRRFAASPEGKRQAAELAARRKKEESDRLRSQTAERIRVAKEFPYYAVISCGVGSGHMTITACFSGDYGSLEIKNGNEYGLYKIFHIVNRRIPNSKEQQDGLIVNLRNNFEINARNGDRKNIILEVKIIQRNTGNIIFQKQVDNFGTIRIGN